MLVIQSCPTICDPIDCSPPGFSVHGIFQERILEWVFSSPEDLPDSGIEPRSLALQADSSPSEPLHRSPNDDYFYSNLDSLMKSWSKSFSRFLMFLSV